MTDPSATYPLEGLKVLDFSRVVAGPFATRMLSDLGAEVLKVEPPEGDLTRRLGRQGEGVSGFYLQNNIGKRNICLDLKTEGARDIALKLAEKADIVVENFRPGVMERFGLGWDDLSAVNPALVMLSISGFGQQGPERGRAAYAPILHAESGQLARQAQIIGGPVGDYQLSLADTYSSLHGLVGVFAALRVAEKTGIGQQIDLAMINVIHATDDYAHWALDGIWPKPEESVVWDAPEGQKVLISSDLKWLWHLLSRDGVADPTPEGADLASKIASRRQAIADWVRGHDSFDALTAQLDALNLAWGRVRDFGEDSFSQPSAVARDVLVDVEDERGEPRRTVQSPYRFSQSPSGIDTGARPSKRGENNAEALADWLGMSEDEVSALTQAGVLQTEE
ncbi:MAG: CoA transferase [Sphingomonadaceae bacterium]|nr:CoA transferase [Sphingomonadaceae bacterium]